MNTPHFSITETSWHSVTSNESTSLWALVDGVNWPEIQSILAEEVPPHASLYTTTDPETKRLGPWLIRVEPNSVIQTLLETRDPNTHAVVFFHSQQGIRQLRSHFRHYTLLWTPANPAMPEYFRFYDPRVLMDMMSALEEHKLAQFFKGIDTVYLPNSFQINLPTHVNLLPPSLDNPLLITEVCLAINVNQRDIPFTQASQSFSVSPIEFQRFTELLKQRKPHHLAITLYQSYQDYFPAIRYEVAAKLSCQYAPKYQLLSSKEYLLLADCYLWLGQDFPANSPAAQVLLTEKHSQRFHHLMKWLEGEKQRIAQSDQHRMLP